jgi:hypothetical protein
MMIVPNVAPVVLIGCVVLTGLAILPVIMMLYLLIGRQKEPEMTSDGVFAMKKIIPVTVDLTLNDDNDHPSVSAPSTPATPSAQFRQVTPPTSIEPPALYE